jgi:hypothetical protein
MTNRTVSRYKDIDVMNNIENTPLNPLFLEGKEQIAIYVSEIINIFTDVFWQYRKIISPYPFWPRFFVSIYFFTIHCLVTKGFEKQGRFNGFLLAIFRLNVLRLT